MTKDDDIKQGYVVHIELFIPASVNRPHEMARAARILSDLEFRDYVDRSTRDDGGVDDGEELLPVKFSFKHVSKRK